MKNTLIPMSEQAQVPKYGVTEAKKAELDALTVAVLDAQGEVDQYQAMVTSLTEKLSTFEGYLAVADTNRTLALNNKNLVIDVVNAAKDLRDNSVIAYDEVVHADALTNLLANDIKDLIDKLIYSAEVIEKLSSYIVRAKALNPLISDDLITMVNQAGTDANNAVALTLVALDSTFAAQATNAEADAASALENAEAEIFYEMLITDRDTTLSINTLLYNAYDNACSYYDREQNAVDIVTDQLSQAQAKLDAATIELNSLEAGLAAANAAALAS